MATQGRHSQPTPRKRQNQTQMQGSGSGRPFDISRRQFVIGASVLGAAVAVGGGAYFVTESNKDTSGQTKLKVGTDQVITIDDLDLDDNINNFLVVERQVSFDYNTLVFANDENILSVLESTGEGSPLFNACSYSLSSGNKEVLLSGPVTDRPRFDVFDFRTNENGSVWIETNVFTSENIVYTCPADSDHEANATIAMSFDSSKQMPQIVACGKYAWIQTAPASDSTGKHELWRIKFGANESTAEKIMETKAFATTPTWAKSGVIVTPRNEITSSSYDIMLLDEASAEVKDICSLQQSMTPQDVSWGSSGFSFTFKGSYEIGDGIAKVGTYVQTDLGTKLSSSDNTSRDARNEDLSKKGWISFNREPNTASAWIGDYTAIKSTSSVAIIDAKNKKYATISADDGADDYGVWLVSSGETDRLVTLQNINYTSLSGDTIKECSVKVWNAA